MEVTNVIFYDEMPWESYIALPGLSFSGLKDFKADPNSTGIRIGSLVHKYTLKPKEYNYEHADVVIPISRELIKFITPALLQRAKCECPITADLIFNGFILKWRGMPDMFLINSLVIDLKVIEGDLEAYCAYFNYPNQLRGYMKPVGASMGLIIAWSKKKKKVQTKIILPDDSWWENIIITRGELL